MSRAFDRKRRSSARRPIRTMAGTSSRSPAMSHPPISDTQWNAVLNRDTSVTGEFVYGVKTTRIYCRPTCPARRPLRKNVLLFAATAAAREQGYRACKRCRPDEATGSRSASPINAIIGSTPKEYQTAARLRTLKQELRKDSQVSDAIYQAGFGPGSRVYEKADGQLGMTPSEYRSGGKGLTISYASGPTPLGLMMIGATDRGICFLQFGDSDEALLSDLRQQFSAAAVQPMPDSSRGQF